MLKASLLFLVQAAAQISSVAADSLPWEPWAARMLTNPWSLQSLTHRSCTHLVNILKRVSMGPLVKKKITFCWKVWSWHYEILKYFCSINNIIFKNWHWLKKFLQGFKFHPENVFYNIQNTLWEYFVWAFLYSVQIQRIFLLCCWPLHISSVIVMEAFCLKMKNKFTNFHFLNQCITSNLSVSHSAISSYKMLTWWETYPTQIQ